MNPAVITAISKCDIVR